MIGYFTNVFDHKTFLLEYLLKSQEKVWEHCLKLQQSLLENFFACHFQFAVMYPCLSY